MRAALQLIEVAIVYVIDRLLTPSVQWMSGKLGFATPELPVVKTAYLGFGFTLLLMAWLKLRGEKLSDFGLGRPRKWLPAIGLGIGFFLIVLAYAVVLQPQVDAFLVSMFGPNRGAQTFQNVRGNLGLYLFALPCIWVFAALGEEFFYRGYLMRRLVSVFGDTKLGWTLALVLQAIGFGGAHLYQGLSGAIGVALYGLAYGLAVRVGGRNLIPAILAHGLLDTLAFTLLYLGAM